MMKLNIQLFGGRGARASFLKTKTYKIEKKIDSDYPKYRTITLYDGKNKAGYLEYQNNDGNITINVIETENKYKRQGVATRLLQELKDEYGDKIYKFSAVLSDGDKLLRKRAYRLEQRLEKLNRVKEIRQKLGI